MLTRSVPRARRGPSRRAITLVELTLVLSLAAIVVFVAVRAYSQAQANSRIQQATNVVSQVRAAVIAYYGNTSNFTGLTVSTVINVLPKSIISGSAVINPYQGSAAVGPDTFYSANDSYYVTITNVPLDGCKRLATMDLGRAAVAMKVDSANGGGAVANATSTPMTPAQAISACTGAANSIGWQLQ